MTVTIDGANGITTPDLTSTDNIVANGSAVLTSASNVASTNLTGTISSARMPSGSIIQITSGSSIPGQVISSTSTSFVDSGIIEVVITPLAAASKIYVKMDGFQTHSNPQADNWGGSLHIYRKIDSGSYAPVNGSSTNGLWGTYKNNQYGDAWLDVVAGIQYLDSPTYTVGQVLTYRAFYKKSTRGAGAFYMNHQGGITVYMGQINVIATAMEIVG